MFPQTGDRVQHAPAAMLPMAGNLGFATRISKNTHVLLSQLFKILIELLMPRVQDKNLKG